MNQTTSKSESLASTSLEDSQITTGTTAKDKLQGLINQATDFVNSDAFKLSSSDLKTALAATVKQYATVMQSSTSLTEQDYQYGIDNLALLMNEIKSPSTSIKPNIFMVNTQTNSSLGTPDGNTDPKDTPAYLGNDGKNNYKWIPGDKDNRLWWDINAYTSRDTHQTIGVAKNNVEVKKEDLGGGKTKWTITFYPGHGVYYDGYKASDYGLVHAQMGFYLTRDYKINSDVNVHISLRPGTTYYYKGLDFPLGTGLKVRTSANDPASGNVNPEANITFKPGDVNKTNGVISDTPNKFYQFGRYADIGNMPDNFDNLVFSDRVSDTNDKIGNAFAFNNEFDNATARDGQNSKDMVVNKAPFTDSFNEKTIGTAMYLQSWGDTQRDMSASYTVTFTTLHSNADQADLAAGNYNGAFSGVYAIANTYQNGIGWDYVGTKYTSYPTLQGQLVGQEVYNYDKDTKTIDSTIPNSLTSESTRESESTSESVSTSQKESESKSVSLQSDSLSKSLSTSLSASTSLSESLSASTSLSESLSASTSLSESLSASTSLSESLSASTSLSESFSASTSLSESLSASTSLSESLSASTSLSESLSVSTSLSGSSSMTTDESDSLSRSLSESESLSESLSTSSSLSKSLSGSSSMNTDASDSLSRSLSESLSTSLSKSLSGSSSMNTDASDSLSRSLSGSSSMNTDASDSISRFLSESESLSTSSSLSASASLIDSLSESLSNTISSENMNDGTNGNMIATTNPGAVNKVSSDSLKHTVQRKELPQTGDSSTNAGVLGGLFVLTSLALMKAKKKKD